MSDQNFTYSPALKDKVFRFSLRLLEDYEDARDVVQDVFVKLWTKPDVFARYSSPEALCMKMTRDLCLDRLKHRNMKREKLKVLAAEHPKEQPKVRYDEKQLGELAKDLIAQLPEKQKMVIHLRDVEAYELDEIQKILEMDATAVRMNLSRARKVIREKLLKLMSHGL